MNVVKPNFSQRVTQLTRRQSTPRKSSVKLFWAASLMALFPTLGCQTSGGFFFGSSRAIAFVSPGTWNLGDIKSVSPHCALHRAVFRNDLAQVDELLAKGYRLNTPGEVRFRDGSRALFVFPLDLARLQPTRQMEETLLFYGAKSSEEYFGTPKVIYERITGVQSDSPLPNAVWRGDIKKVNQLLDQGYRTDTQALVTTTRQESGYPMSIQDIAALLTTDRMEKFLKERLP